MPGNDQIIATMKKHFEDLKKTGLYRANEENKKLVKTMEKTAEFLYEEVEFQYDMLCHFTELVSMYALHCKEARPLPSKELHDRALQVLHVMSLYAEEIKK